MDDNGNTIFRTKADNNLNTRKMAVICVVPNILIDKTEVL